MVDSDVEREQQWLKEGECCTRSGLAERDAEIVQLKDIVSDGVNVTINPLCRGLSTDGFQYATD